MFSKNSILGYTTVSRKVVGKRMLLQMGNSVHARLLEWLNLHDSFYVFQLNSMCHPTSFVVLTLMVPK